MCVKVQSFERVRGIFSKTQKKENNQVKALQGYE